MNYVGKYNLFFSGVISNTLLKNLKYKDIFFFNIKYRLAGYYISNSDYLFAFNN